MSFRRKTAVYALVNNVCLSFVNTGFVPVKQIQYSWSLNIIQNVHEWN